MTKKAIKELEVFVSQIFYTFFLFISFFQLPYFIIFFYTFFTHNIYPHPHPHPRPTTSTHYPRPTTFSYTPRNGIPDHQIQALGRWPSNALYQLYIRTPSEALVGISSQLAWHHVSLPFVIHISFDIAVELSTELPWACTMVFWCCSHCQLHSVGTGKCVVFFFFDSTAAAWYLGLLESEVPFHPCSLAPPFSSTKEILVGWGPLAGLPCMDTSSSC